MRITSSIGISVSIFIYLLIGSIGYIMYGSILTDSMLDSMGMDDLSTGLVVLENIAYILNVIMCFPITFSVFKNYLIYALSLILTHFRDKKNMQVFKKFYLQHKIQPSIESKENIEMGTHEMAKNNESTPNHLERHTSGKCIIKTDDQCKVLDKDLTDKKDDIHKDNKGSHSAHDMVEISRFIQNLIFIIVLITIIVIANFYSDMKIV